MLHGALPFVDQYSSRCSSVVNEVAQNLRSSSVIFLLPLLGPETILGLLFRVFKARGRNTEEQLHLILEVGVGYQ